MFDALKNEGALESVTIAVGSTGISFDDALEMAASSCMDALLSRADETDGLQETLDNLMALESAVARFGLSKALLAFADKDGVLSTKISGIPSLESLTADLSAEDSTAAVEGLGTTIKSVGKAVLQSILNAFTIFPIDVIGRTVGRVKVWRHIIDGIDKNLSELEFSKEKAESIHSKVLPYHDIIELQKAYLGAPKALLALWTQELPRDQKDFEHWLNKIRSIVGPAFKTEKATIKDNGKPSVPLKQWFVLKFGEKGSLAEKGYTSEEQLKEVINGYRRLLQTFDSLNTIRDTIKSHVEKLTKEGEEFDTHVVAKAAAVYKNLTKALIFHGLFGVSAASMNTIQGVKKAFVKKGGAAPKEEPATEE